MNYLVAYLGPVLGFIILLFGWVLEWFKKTSFIIRLFIVIFSLLSLVLSLVAVHKEVAQKNQEIDARRIAERNIELIKREMLQKPEIQLFVNDKKLLDDRLNIIHSVDGVYQIKFSLLNNGNRAASQISFNCIFGVTLDRISTKSHWKINNLSGYDSEEIHHFTDLQLVSCSIRLSSPLHVRAIIKLPPITILDTGSKETVGFLITIATSELGKESKIVHFMLD